MAFDAASSASGDNVSSLTWSHTCTGSDRILVVTVGFEDTLDGPTGVTYNGVAMTELPNSPQNNNNGNVAMFYLVAPATGANDIVVTNAGGTDTAGLAQSRTGIDQSTPLGTDVGATGNSLTPSVTVSSASGEECVCGFGYGRSGQTITMDSPGTSRGTVAAGSSGFEVANITGGHGEQAGDTSVTMSWASDGTADDWAIIGVPLKPATGGGDTEVSATTDALTLTEQAATVNAETNVQAGVDSLTLAENAASVTLGVEVQASTDALTLSEFAATVNAETNVQAATDSLTLTEQVATVTVSGDVNVQASLAELTLQEQAATVNAAINVSADKVGLRITTFQAVAALHRLEITDTNILTKPVNAWLAEVPPFKHVVTEFDIPERKTKNTAVSSQGGRMKKGTSSQKTTTGGMRRMF